MARTVYPRGKHYIKVEDLKVAIQEVWTTLSSELFLKLYNNVPRRIHAVMDARGSATNY